MMGETYLFQIGIVTTLISRFSLSLGTILLHILFTGLIGFWRLRNFSSGQEIEQMWNSEDFQVLSSLHNVFAVVVYGLMLQVAVVLGDFAYYSENEAWKAISRPVKS